MVISPVKENKAGKGMQKTGRGSGVQFLTEDSHRRPHWKGDIWAETWGDDSVSSVQVSGGRAAPGGGDAVLPGARGEWGGPCGGREVEVTRREFENEVRLVIGRGRRGSGATVRTPVWGLEREDWRMQWRSHLTSRKDQGRQKCGFLASPTALRSEQFHLKFQRNKTLFSLSDLPTTLPLGSSVFREITPLTSSKMCFLWVSH